MSRKSRLKKKGGNRRKRKIRSSLGKKLAVIIVAFSVLLTGVALCLSCYLFNSAMINHYYIRLGGSLTQMLARQLSAEDLDRYYESGRTDAMYDEIMQFIQNLMENADVEYLYVVRPYNKGIVYLFDSDTQIREDGNRSAGGHCDIGTYEELTGEFAENFDKLLAGKRVPPIVEEDPVYGWLMTVMTPICREDGTMAGYVMADISLDDVMRDRKAFLLLMGVALGIVTLVFTRFSLWLVKRNVIRPIDMLTAATEDFMESDQEELGIGNVTVNVPVIRTRDELERLANAFRKMEEDIISYIRNIMKVTAEKERISVELNVATQIQADMLPRVFPAFPSRKEFDIYATMTPARAVGGDFYDFYFVDDDHLAMVIADVSGKSVPAALFMVIAKTILKNYTQSGIAPGEVFTRTNDQLCEGNDAGLFVTAWMGILELSTGNVTYVNAGHNPPLVRDADGTVHWLRTRPNFVLAGMEGIRYREDSLVLRPGDRLYLYTDGVTEGCNTAQELFGNDRLKRALEETGNLSIREMLEKVKSDLDTFVGEAEQFDDITMLGLEYRGVPQRKEGKDR